MDAPNAHANGTEPSSPPDTADDDRGTSHSRTEEATDTNNEKVQHG